MRFSRRGQPDVDSRAWWAETIGGLLVRSRPFLSVFRPYPAGERREGQWGRGLVVAAARSRRHRSPASGPASAQRRSLTPAPPPRPFVRTSADTACLTVQPLSSPSTDWRLSGESPSPAFSWSPPRLRASAKRPHRRPLRQRRRQLKLRRPNPQRDRTRQPLPDRRDVPPVDQRGGPRRHRRHPDARPRTRPQTEPPTRGSR